MRHVQRNPPLEHHMAHDDLESIARMLAERFIAHPADASRFERALNHALAAASDAPDLDDPVLRGYLYMALWSSNDEDGHPLTNTTEVEDFSPEAVRKAKRDIARFLKLLEKRGVSEGDVQEVQFRMGPSEFGHDIWLTRNRHGVGFWDRSLGQVGRVLTKCAHELGESYVTVDDEGNVELA